MGWLWVWLACASWVGLEELDGPPADFPLTLTGEPGHFTRAASGAVSVDLAFDDEALARAAADRLRAEAEGRGFRPVAETVEKKRTTTRLDGAPGRIDVGCCPQRADRRWLVLLSWWPAGSQGG